MKRGWRYDHEKLLGIRCSHCAYNVQNHPERPMVRCINRRCRERGKWKTLGGKPALASIVEERIDLPNGNWLNRVGNMWIEYEPIETHLGNTL